MPGAPFMKSSSLRLSFAVPIAIGILVCWTRCHRWSKVDPPTGEKRTHLSVIVLALPTDFRTHLIACFFA